MADAEVTVAAGNLRSPSATAVGFPHRWTDEGVTVEADFTGAHLLHLAVAGCVLNDLYREAAGLGIGLDGVRVLARGGFDPVSWQSTGITYQVEVRSAASPGEVAELLARVDAVAEIPKAVRSSASVTRVP
ncbi:OsmC-like protein [Nakamurella panacisegetis]|uniref:OsmC-like protein n=1 Tax=Nakamurella panacisegetis TaxID=1090615 RepID=A0A1H0SW47_9ACTN|nr:OsmC family protein [Nakamurella panacisegetis]SDP45458.1 OsmC-like protein [Nakamurella panacisegetis]